MDGNDEELLERWFAQGESAELSEAAPFEEMSNYRSRVGVVIAAISATVVALLIVFADRV